MAADSTGKGSPGSPIKTLPARVWNNMVDAGRAFADGQLSSTAPAATRTRPTDLLKLKNSSGAMRRKGEILQLGSRAITNITDEHIWLDGTEPTDDCRFGILKEPAESGTSEVYTAQVSGLCLALVNVTDAAHTFAVPADGEYVLQSAEDEGPIEIVEAPAGTGELECVVRFFRKCSATAGSCGACNTPSGTADVDLSSFATGLVASTYYRWDLFCTGALIVLFTYDAGGVWNGENADPEGSLTLNCDGEESPVSFTITLAVTGSGHLPGEVTITVTVDGDTWVWENRESWQPDQKWEFTLVSGGVDCPCAPFRKRSCLVPDDGEE